jgi:hypothetical protein
MEVYQLLRQTVKIKYGHQVSDNVIHKHSLRHQLQTPKVFRLSMHMGLQHIVAVKIDHFQAPHWEPLQSIFLPPSL